MASQILRRIVDGAVPAEVIRRVNAVIDMLNGNQPGRINLDADDGAKLNPIGGASISTGNHALRVRAASGEHVLVRNAANSADLLEVDDTSGVATANLSVTGNLTIVGTGRTIKADWSNATIANRLTFETSTANANTVLQMRPSGTGTAAGLNVYNTNGMTAQRFQMSLNASTGVLAVESTGGAALPLTFYTNALARMVLETDGILTQSYGVRLANLIYLVGRNAANTADIQIARVNGSNVIETGQTGTRHNLLGTVVAPDIDPPTVNGQVTQRAVAAAWAYFTVAGGAVTLRDSYNVTSVTYNAAGDYTVTWDRDFSSAYYACLPSVEDNGAVLLAPKVNSQAAGSADIWVYNVAAAKTDPDAVSVVCFGTLS